MVPIRPLTVCVEGKGVALPKVLIVTTPGAVLVEVVPVVPPRSKVKAMSPRSVPPSFRLSVAVRAEPQAPSAVKVNILVAAGPPAIRAPYESGPLGDSTPPAASRVAITLVVWALPLFCSANRTATCSSGSIAPLPRPQFSAVISAPAETMSGASRSSAL